MSPRGYLLLAFPSGDKSHRGNWYGKGQALTLRLPSVCARLIKLLWLAAYRESNFVGKPIAAGDKFLP